MAKTKKLTASEVDGVQYRRAPVWQIALAQLNSGSAMCFYILMGYASYVANAGYGIATAVVGFILTGTRIFDSVTDPLIAMLIDKTNTRFGKIRIMLVGGWIIEAAAVLFLFDWVSGKGQGIVTFILIYAIYIIGYTMNNVAAQVIGPVLTNDPKQRPTVGVWSTVYNYITPMIFSMTITLAILPKYGNQFTMPMLAEASHLCLIVSGILLVLCCIGVTPVDKMENFVGISTKKKSDSVKLKDMWALLKSNKALQMYIIAGASDKIAITTASQAVVGTMLFGIIIGNMQISSILSLIGMLPSILFAIFGARYAGKHGSKETVIRVASVSIIVAIVSVAFFLIIDPRQITVVIPLMVIFVILTLLMNGCKMCITTATGAMLADIIDFELDRSGKYMPAAVTGTHMFIDKLVSSLGATIAAGCVALIGYTTVMPQPTDAASPAIFWVTMGIYYFLPILGWLCSLFALKFSPLSKATMIEVQKGIVEKKAAAKAAEIV